MEQRSKVDDSVSVSAVSLSIWVWQPTFTPVPCSVIQPTQNRLYTSINSATAVHFQFHTGVFGFHFKVQV